jgi:hypothetical protein
MFVGALKALGGMKGICCHCFYLGIDMQSECIIDMGVGHGLRNQNIIIPYIYLLSPTPNRSFFTPKKVTSKLGTSELVFQASRIKDMKTSDRKSLTSFFAIHFQSIKSLPPKSQNLEISARRIGVPSIRAAHRVWPRGLPYLPLETDKIQSRSVFHTVP